MIGADEPAGVLWVTPSFEEGAYADEARHLIVALRRGGVAVQAEALDGARPDRAGRSGADTDDLEHAVAQPRRGAPVVVEHFPGAACRRIGRARRHIGRTASGTWSLPPSWVAGLNEMDEVWVPSEFNVDTFERSGVTAPISVVPRGVDAELFRPGRPGPGCVFVSVGSWSARHGWDTLVAAWAEAFGPSDAVTLVLHDTGGEPGGSPADLALATVGRTRADTAPIVTTHGVLTEPALARLLGSAHAYVGPSKGDAWGRPVLEAMACGLGVIATRWGAAPSMLDETNGMLLEIDGIEPALDAEDAVGLDGQWWARPSATHLVELLRRVAGDPDAASALGRRARDDVLQRWTWASAAAVARARLEEHGVALPAADSGTRVRWVGDQFAHHSLALVNRELCQRLVDTPGISLEVATREPWWDMEVDAPPLDALVDRAAPALTGPPQVEVRHQWPPDWSPPEHGAWVVIQPWEYGGIPQTWMDHLADVDEVWCPSEFVRSCYILSGMPPDRVHRVPNGVDADLFRPEGSAYPLRTAARTTFLFVGGTISRKGIDVLLDAYTGAFREADDVCLVIKSTCGDSFYRGQTNDAHIRDLAASPGVPPIELIDADLDAASVAALYRACDALVHPYRGEGFALPIAEAMACGLPVVVTGYGACLDYCDDTTAYLIPALLQPVTLDQSSPLGAWWAEPDVGELAAILRRIHEDPDEARQRGAAGRARVRAQLPWDAAAALAAGRITVLGSRTPVRLRRRRATSPPVTATAAT